MKDFLSDRAKNITPYVAGEQPKASGVIKLNTNENPYPPSPAVQAAIDAVSGDGMRKYPDTSGGAFRFEAAKMIGCKPTQVFCGNGSDEVLAFAFQAFFGPKHPMTAPEITYSFYPVWAKMYEIPYHTVAMNLSFEINPMDYFNLDTGIVIANPNAPTGIALSKDAIASIVKSNPNHAVIVDEAYVDFGAESVCDLIDTYDNLLVVRTLSKSESLAGLRAGFAVGHEALIDGLIRIRDSFNSYPVNKITSEAAAAALKDRVYYKDVSNKIIKTREWTTKALEALGFKVLPSSTNFVFASPQKVDAKNVFEALKQKNVFVRWFNHDKINQYLRISIGTDEEMKTLIRCLNDIMSEER